MAFLKETDSIGNNHHLSEQKHDMADAKEKSGGLDWRAEHELTDFDPDDELLRETPPEVVAALGFDPIESVKRSAE